MSSGIASLPRDPDILLEMIAGLRAENEKLRAMLETLKQWASWQGRANSIGKKHWDARLACSGPRATPPLQPTSCLRQWEYWSAEPLQRVSGYTNALS